MKDFVVVEFPEEEAVDVIYQAWVVTSQNGKQKEACWPDFDVVKKAKGREHPHLSWKRYPVRILGSAGTRTEECVMRKETGVTVDSTQATRVERPNSRRMNSR